LCAGSLVLTPFCFGVPDAPRRDFLTETVFCPFRLYILTKTNYLVHRNKFLAISSNCLKAAYCLEMAIVSKWLRRRSCFCDRLLNSPRESDPWRYADLFREQNLAFMLANGPQIQLAYHPRTSQIPLCCTGK